MTWWKGTDHNYFNSDLVDSVHVEGAGSSWRIDVHLAGNDTSYPLAGEYSSEANAEEAMARLVQGFDPASLVT